MLTYKLILSLAILATGVSTYSVQKSDGRSKKIVCYFGSWATYRPGDGEFDVEDIDPMMCTHMIFGFAGLGYDYKIFAIDAYNELEENWGKGAYRRFTNLKLRNPALKTILAIGGWNEGSVKYSDMALTPERRRTFIDSVIPFLQKQGFDGLDLDWEYPTQRGGIPVDRANFATLLSEVRTEFDKHGLLLTAAVSAGHYTIIDAYDVPSMSQSLDFISVMAYDFRGAWDFHPYTGHHSAVDAMDIDVGNDSLLNTKHALEFWRESGAPLEKLIVGLPTYGRGFTLQDPSNTGFYSPSTLGIPAGPYTREAGYWGYNEICEELNKGGWTLVRNEKVVGPYAYKNNLWVGYDDENSIRTKAEWVNSMGFGGAMFWSLDTDDFQGKCGEESALIKTAYRTIIGEIQPEPTTTVDPNVPTTTSTTTQPPPTPPSDGMCYVHGQFLGELCDSAFFICIANGDEWTYVSHPCNHPLYYDPAIQNCNWGDVIGCYDRKRT